MGKPRPIIRRPHEKDFLKKARLVYYCPPIHYEAALVNTFINLYRTLFAKRFFYKWNRTLLKCALSGLGVGNCGKRISGELHCLQEIIGNKEKPVVFDIGANIGEWSELALQINPGIEIYAFEPQKCAFEKLNALPGIHAFNAGCGSMPGKLTLYDRPDISSQTHSSFCKEAIAHLGKGVVEDEADVVTIDQFVEEHQIQKIDLMKIDVEGFEMEVLQGAKKCLKNGLISAIQFEFNSMSVFKRVYFKDFYDFLPNFAFYRLLPQGKIPLRHYDPTLHELFTFQNVLAVAKQ